MSVFKQKSPMAYSAPTIHPVEVSPERFVMGGSPVTNPGFPGVDIYEDEF